MSNFFDQSCVPSARKKGVEGVCCGGYLVERMCYPVTSRRGQYEGRFLGDLRQSQPRDDR